MLQYSSRAHLVCTLQIIEEGYAMRGSRMAVELTPPPTRRCQVLRYLPEKHRYTLELLEPPPGGGGAGKRMDVRPANFVLAHLPAGTRCARARRLH